eukprot:TRINITY_DN16138_c0_g1_i1.p1 TRINITY_DN16138_c0_g1~~TRINITY_DN16138_c0_g1_i1.p1  ORF type:complete len:236 (-),score=27.88 TRINITY_DN16138_c0_g1_i1:307-981(-)
MAAAPLSLLPSPPRWQRRGASWPPLLSRSCPHLHDGRASTLFLLYLRQNSLPGDSFWHLGLSLISKVLVDGEIRRVTLCPSVGGRWYSSGRRTSRYSSSEDGNDTQSSSARIFERLKAYGIAGVLSYGLLNTAYYLSAFLIVWTRVLPSPGQLGVCTSATRCVKVLAMVWAGSQLTKILRAGGALLLAPAVDCFLSWLTDSFDFKSRADVFALRLHSCSSLSSQ